jgi:hypothetical protein
MTLRAYTASDVTFKVYRFDIPASPISGGNGACKNLKRVSQLSSSNWSPSGQDPEGLTALPGGRIAFISEDDAAAGVYSQAPTPLPATINHFRRTSPDRFGTEAGLAYNAKDKRFYNLQADSFASPNKSKLYHGPVPSNNVTGSTLVLTAKQPSRKYADGLGINGNGLALASSARNISASNPAGIYRVSLSNGTLTLVSNQSASDKLGVNQDTGADFAPGKDDTFYILAAKKGEFFRYTGFNARTGAGGTLTKLCTADLRNQPGERPEDEVSRGDGGEGDPLESSRFEGLAVIDEPLSKTASDPNPEAPFTFASLTGIDFGLAAPIAAGIVLGGLGALVKKLYK